MKKRSPHPRNSGIALIIVLGFLGILLLLAVSFAISMRVERLATHTYLDQVRAKHLVHAALSRALSAVNTNMASSGQILRMIPRPEYHSVGESNINLRTESVINFLPNEIASSQVPAAQWEEVIEENHTSGKPYPIRGRTAWQVFDMSGMLDGNYTCGLARGAGTNLAEVTPFEINNPTMYTSQRDLYVRFETVPELSEFTKSSSGTPTNVVTQVPFGYFPAGYFDSVANTTNDAIDISGDFGGNRVAIENALSEAGFTDSPMLTEAMIDFIDEDHVPLNLLSFTMEAVPLINEIAFTNEVEAVVVGVDPNTGAPVGAWHNRVKIRLELWFPFGNTNEINYLVKGRLRTNGGTPGFGWGNPASFTLVDVGPHPSPWGFDTYHLVEIMLEKVTPPGQPPELPAKMALEFNVENPSGEVVDQIKAYIVDWKDVFPQATVPELPGMSGLAGPSSPVAAAMNGLSNTSVGFSHWEVNDPRMNWDWGAHWNMVAGHSLLGPNSVLTVTSDPKADGHHAMYVRNGPLISLGDLGFLPYAKDKPWWTIRFLQDDPNDSVSARVLDLFVVDKRTEGFMNLNSQQAVSFASVFRQVPIEVYPGASGGEIMSDEDAFALAPRIVANGPYLNLSSIDQNSSSDVLPGGTAMEAESVIRNTIGLLRARQNLMTIYLGAQVLADNTDEVVADARAVAVVWRDPYPNASGVHPTFVRYFKWLTEL